MSHYNYLIIGGGMAAYSAVMGIRELDGKGSIGLISAEPTAPYDRPPLTKQLWFGRKQFPQIFHELPASVDGLFGRRAQQLDRADRQVVDDQGTRFTYDRLLLATGSRPRKLPFGGDNVLHYRTVRDYERLRALSAEHDRFLVIGGGFIGSEIASALAQEGKQVSLVFPNEGICRALFPEDLSKFLNDYYESKGVSVLSGESVTDVRGAGADLKVLTANGRELQVQGVVAGIGVLPNTGLAEGAGLTVDNGIVVNDRLQTSDPSIFAAGDVANYPDAVLGVRRRVEHEDAAHTMGKAAGRLMAGADEPYGHSPYFYSDLFDLGYEAVGELDGRLDTVADWQEPYQKGVVYYLRGGRIRGVLLWNVWDKVPDARQLIAADREYKPADLKGLLP
jgi:NADPH-dependent 2,4-dienoyl-CoA reductase/sulfur reductase-like enzyme